MLSLDFNPLEDPVDIRYFLIAVGNRGESPGKEVQSGKKVTFIDDLEIPSKKGQNIEQVYYIIEKTCGPLILENIRQAFIAYRLKNISTFMMLQEFEQNLGIIKAFKYYWALSTNCSSNENLEMNKELRKSLRKMSFRDPSCILARAQNYREALTEVCEVLYAFLLSNKDKLQQTTEVRVNSLIGSLHGYSLSHLLQARPLPHLVSTSSLAALRPLLFASGEVRQVALERADTDDLLTVLLLFLVALAKTSDPVSAPGFRGLEWLRDKAREFDLVWLPMAKKDRMPTIGETNTISEEFPAIVPTQAKTGEVNIQEQMAAQALENKQRMALMEKQVGTKWNPFGYEQTQNFNTNFQAATGNSSLPFGFPFGPGFKIPLVDPSKPLPKQLTISTIPVNPFGDNFATGSNQRNLIPVHKEEPREVISPSIDEEPIDCGIPIFKKPKKKK